MVNTEILRTPSLAKKQPSSKYCNSSEGNSENIPLIIKTILRMIKPTTPDEHPLKFPDSQMNNLNTLDRN